MGKPGEDSSRSRMLILLCVGAYCLISFCVIIGSRFHYTDDVLLGALVCSLAFGYYHTALRAAAFHDGPFWRLLRDYESDSPDMQAWMCCATQSRSAEEALSNETSLPGMARAA